MAIARRPSKQPNPAVTEKMVDDWVALYADGKGEPLSAIAKAYQLSPATVRYHLKKRGALAPSQETEMDAAGVDEDDEALGIGVDDDEPQPAFTVEALMEHPEFSKVLEAAVAQKLAQMGHQAPAQPMNPGSATFDAFLEKLEHVMGVRDEQRAGYIKPLTAEEMDARKQGAADMKALLRRFKAENIWPTYLIVGEGPGAFFYGPSPNGDISYEAGTQIRCRLPPSELFQPVDEAAAQVIEAYRRSVGDPIPIEDLVSQAIINARGPSQAPAIEQTVKVLEPEVMIVDAPKRETGAKRTFGTIVPELRGQTMPKQPGVSAQPVGPVFVDG